GPAFEWTLDHIRHKVIADTSGNSQSGVPIVKPLKPVWTQIDGASYECRCLAHSGFHAFSDISVSDNHAFPADELMPLSCKGRYRDPLNSRGDLDYTLGNFSLTMIDSLDSLFLFSALEEFESAVRLVLENVRFDTDVDVSVFETNIRILGGLLGAHVSAMEIQKANSSRMKWYTDELLQMATDIGDRLLPAFNTSTGIPLPIINLRYGDRGVKLTQVSNIRFPFFVLQESTCTACAGTMILEFAALSRLTGNPIYEEKAVRAMAYLWKQRSRYSDLVGRVINVHSGDWVLRDSGIGAGIDSYYEYLLKAYVLLGEPVYLHRFHTHYQAIKRYVSGPESARFPFLFLDVNMHSPSQRSRSFMDALFAFWPGIQVLLGDIKSAVALHEYLFQVHKRNKLLPEAFTPDLRVHWGQHLMRPEFIESTYLLYRATNDPYYLEVGARVVDDLQNYTRVPCGYAAVEDVRTMNLSDRFDSFVLAETFKYLYLLFTEPSDLPFSLGDYIFTTEAHLLPLSLSQVRPKNTSSVFMFDGTHNAESHISPVEPTDHHGDRDPSAEAKLRRSSICPAVEFEYTHPFSPNECRPIQEFLDNGHKISNIDTTSCSIWDGPSCHRGRRMLMHLTQPERLIPYACPGAITQRMWQTIELIREPLRQLGVRSNTAVQDYSTPSEQQGASHVPLLVRASDFRPENPNHLSAVKQMGIEFSVTKDGRLMLRHDQSTADSPQLALAGLLFIQELLLLNKVNQHSEGAFVEPRHVVLLNPPSFGRVRFSACPAYFGLFPGESNAATSTVVTGDSQSTTSHTDKGTDEETLKALPSKWRPLVAPVRVAYPLDGCTEVHSEGTAYPSPSLKWDGNSDESAPEATMTDLGTKLGLGPLAGSIGLIRRGGCLFAGAVGGIVVDNIDHSSASVSSLFTMSGEEDPAKNDVDIPFVLLFGKERDHLLDEMQKHWKATGKPTEVMITKKYDPTVSLTAAFNAFKEHQLSWAPHNIPITQFTFHSNVRSSSDVSRLHVYRLPSLASGGLSVTRLPGQSYSCNPRVYENPATCSFDGPTPVGPHWRLSLLVGKEELNTYYTSLDGGSPQNTDLWISGLNVTMWRTRMSAHCTGILLALAEAALFKASKADATVPTFPAFWVLRVDTCLDQLHERARFEYAFHTSNTLHNVNFLEEVSMTWTFQPLLDMVTSSTQI
ncbi:glycosyl hydrolase family 47, partial [Opisthorchis viverrini]